MNTFNTEVKQIKPVIFFNGFYVMGSGMTGATIKVELLGQEIGQTTVGDDGRIQLNIDPALKNKEVIQVTYTDPTGYTEVISLVAPDLTQPDAPTIEHFDGINISGTAEPGSIVKIKIGQKELAEVIADENGQYYIQLDPALSNGEIIEVTATDEYGNESNAAYQVADDTTAPDAPLAKVENGFIVGTAEAGAVIELSYQGKLLGTTIADAEGVFSFPIDSTLKNGEFVHLTATDTKQNISSVTELQLPDITAPDMPVISTFDGETLNGIAEAYSVVEVKLEGVVIGFAQADSNGHYSIHLKPALSNSEIIEVTAKDASNNISKAAKAEAPFVPDTTAPDAPEVSINDGLDVVTVKTEANATVKIYDSMGHVIAQGQADQNGDFSHQFVPALARGKSLDVTATDQAGNESEATNIIVGVAEIIAAADDTVHLEIDAVPEEIVNQNPSDLNKTGFMVASVGLGPVLDLGVLDKVTQNALTVEVGKDQVREITLQGDSGGIQIGGTMDLYVYKLNETTGAWEQQGVEKNWVIAYFLGGVSDDKTFTLTEGKWMFVMASGEGVSALTGYTLKCKSDIIYDYNNADSISGKASGNMLTDTDYKNGQDELPEGSKLIAVNGIKLTDDAAKVIEGLYGKLAVKADGSYEYTLNDNLTAPYPYGEQEVFKYTVQSPEGNIVEADLTIKLDLTAKLDETAIDNTVVLDMDAKKILDTDDSDIPDAIGFKVLDLGLLNPIVDAGVLEGMGAMSFDVGENQIRELTFHGSAGGVSIAKFYDLHIYKLNEETNQYEQIHHEDNWFTVALLGGASDYLTMQFTEGSYKMLLTSTGVLGLLEGAGLYIDHDTIYDYNDPSKFSGTVTGDVTSDSDEILLMVKVNGVEHRVEPGQTMVVNGQYGVLSINSDGSYSYQVVKPNNAPADWKPPYGAVDRFEYITQDGNGNNYVDSLNIKLNTHTAIDDFDHVTVKEKNLITEVKVENDWGAHQSMSKEFTIAENTKTSATLVANSTIHATWMDMTYAIINVYSGEVLYSDQVHGWYSAFDVKFDNIPPGNYRLEVTTDYGHLQGVEFKAESIHLDQFVPAEIDQITGTLIDNDSGTKNIAEIQIGNKEVFTSANKGVDSCDIEGLYGTLTLYKDGSYTYLPKGGVYGVDKFTYTTISTVGTEETATLEINVGKNILATAYDEVASSSAGDDTFNMGEGKDTIIYNVLDYSSNTGGNGIDHWVDFETGPEGDVLDVSELLIGADVTMNNIAEFLSLRTVGDNTVVSIDRDGRGDDFNSVDLIILGDVKGYSLDDLVTNNQIVF